MMTSAGLRVVGWLMVLCGVSCASAPAPKVARMAGAAPARDDAAVPQQPPLTPAPPLALDAYVDVNVARLVESLTAGTSARLDLGSMQQIWLPAMSLQRPISLGMSGTSPGVLSGSLALGAASRPGPADPELAALGLRPLADGFCAVRESGSAPALACGPKALLLSAANGLLARGRELHDDHLAEVELSLKPGPANPVHQWRASAMRQLDGLLPEESELGKRVPLRLGLADFAFEVVDRVVDSYRRLGDLQLGLSSPQAQGFRVSASIAPGAGSALSRAVSGGTNVRVPSSFWDLGAHTSRAAFFDGSLLSPLWEPSARSRALLEEAGGPGSFAEQLLALPQACAQPGRAWALASAHLPTTDVKTAEPAAPALPTLLDQRSREETGPPSYTLIGIEDPGGSCLRAVRAALSTHERLGQVPGQAADKRHLAPIVPGKPLPKALQYFRLGRGAEATHFAIAERKGVLWIGSSSDVATLEAGLLDLLAPPAKRRGLRTRPELASLDRAPALVTGFVRDDDLPFASWVTQRPTERGHGPSDERRRVPFAITKEQAALHASAWLDARSLQQLLAKALSQSLGSVELQKLPVAHLPAALGMLEAACQLGGGDACNALGLTYGDGRGVPKDADRAARFLEIGCELHHGKACANLVFYKSLEKKQELAFLQKSCELEAAFGCAWWGVRLLESDKPSDQQLGFAKLSSACNRFVGFACVRIGNHYQNGVGLPQDYAKAADFHERACELGFGLGCLGAATALTTGKGRPQDPATAFNYVQRACELDKKEGCYALGLTYLSGQLTQKDEAAARQELQVACDANHADACRVLAELSGEP